MRILIAWFYVFLTALSATSATAATFGILTTAGVMQQPTSHYYHACYGTSIDASTEKQGFVARVSYIERPEFSTTVTSETSEKTQFHDKEYAIFGLFGTKATKTRSHGLYVFFGGGRVNGYINSSSGLDRKFSLPGASAVAEYQLHKNNFILAAGHQTFAGYVDDVQLKALVAWPYNFFHASIGYRW